MATSIHIAVAAIDFGTTFSGWAMSFKHDHEKDPTKVFAKNWNSGENISTKTPTAILIAPDGKTVEGFGYDAENKYITLTEEDEHHKHYFFRRFKMQLYKQKLEISRSMELEADNGKRLPAMKVFALAIRYLKDDLLSECGKLLTGGITKDDIHWTLTVPAIWDEKAKKFMREAAIQAGINGFKLTIVLEPEGASSFCQRLPVSKSVDSVASLESGSSYIIIDCGGGTTDICCHEILPDRKLKEIHRANGLDVGGTDVDKAFEQLLTNLFGDIVWRKFKTENPGDFISFLRGFEVKKRDIKPNGGDPITFTIPTELASLSLKSKSLQDLKDLVSQAGFQDVVKVLKGNKMRINADFLRKELYDEVTRRLRNILSKVGKHMRLRQAKTVLLVGGFSESLVIQEVVRKTLPDKRIVTIHEPNLAVVKGAVIYGHDESIVQARVARHTYGKSICMLFDASMHDENEIWIGKDNVKRVSIFKPLVKAEQELQSDLKIDCGYYGPIYEDQVSIGGVFYAIDGNIPTYSNDPRCIKIGKMNIPVTDMSVPLNERGYNLKLKFGGTEILATCIEKRTGNTVEATIDFLG